MDLFSAGCVLAELFLDGKPLFNFSQLTAYSKVTTFLFIELLMTNHILFNWTIGWIWPRNIIIPYSGYWCPRTHSEFGTIIEWISPNNTNLLDSQRPFQTLVHLSLFPRISLLLCGPPQKDCILRISERRRPHSDSPSRVVASRLLCGKFQESSGNKKIASFAWSFRSTFESESKWRRKFWENSNSQ